MTASTPSPETVRTETGCCDSTCCSDETTTTTTAKATATRSNEQPTAAEVRQAVRDNYGAIADRTTDDRAAEGGCGCGPECCSPDGATATNARDLSAKLGYSNAELATAPAGANLGLGCGNPHAIAGLQPGETVLDLGSGGGFDAFLAADRVGATGSVIGVDMTPAMVERARANRQPGVHDHVDFRLGEIEHIPVADASIDVVMSNCVINLSADKPAVMREIARVLRPGGRVAIADIVTTRPLPEAVRRDLELHAGCIAGAATIADLRQMMTDAGLRHVEIHEKATAAELYGVHVSDEDRDISRTIISAMITARR